MAEFAAKVYPVTITPHPNADRIELAQIGDFFSIVKKGQFQAGDLAAYIPRAASSPTPSSPSWASPASWPAPNTTASAPSNSAAFCPRGWSTPRPRAPSSATTSPNCWASPSTSRPSPRT